MSSFIYKIIWNSRTRDLVLWLLFYFYKIRKGRISCVCWSGTNYNCNPRAITEKMVELGLVSKDSKTPFEITYAFVNSERLAEKLPKEIQTVEIGSLKYFYLLATSQFVISNTRFGGGIFWPFKKKKGQYYIQTMHGGHGIKKVEWDAELPIEYLDGAEKDRQYTDLMLSDSSYWTHIYRTSFRYQGEILEQGLPRNDIFFKQVSAESAKPTENKRYLIYTPTFRNNGRKDVYGFDVDKVIAALEKRFGGEWYIRVSSHPNMRSYYREIYDFSHPRMIDVGGEDLQPLLLSSDALITDYSSAEMDFSLRTITRREGDDHVYPIFQLCKDRNDYDRGFYINPEDLPFPYAENDDELIGNILNFDREKYLTDLEKFNREVIGLKETGHAAEAVVEWMMAKARKCRAHES